MAKVDNYLSKQAAELLQAMNDGCYNEDNIPCQIEEGLFLGSFGAANNKDELKRLNITHILTLGNAMPPAYPNDFVYKVFHVSDRPSTNIKQHFNECFDYIEEAKESGGSVLIHCFLGRSRSVAVVVAYLLKKHGMTLFQALDHVKSRRARASPNAGFSTQLYEYEMFLSGAGDDPFTSKLLSAIPLSGQLDLFKQYRSKMIAAVGEERTATIISKGGYVVAVGSDDIANNYFLTPLRSPYYDIPAYTDLLLESASNFVQLMWEETTGNFMHWEQESLKYSTCHHLGACHHREHCMEA